MRGAQGVDEAGNHQRRQPQEQPRTYRGGVICGGQWRHRCRTLVREPRLDRERPPALRLALASRTPATNRYPRPGTVRMY